jgi:hypothetical protein
LPGGRLTAPGVVEPLLFAAGSLLPAEQKPAPAESPVVAVALPRRDDDRG